jgi:FAD/FMN-containing dehydrogenase
MAGAEALPNGIVEYEPGDLTVIAQAGLRLSELDAALERHGQRLSLDPPGDPTLGECLLDDLSGPLRHRFGTMRDLVLGVSFVLPDGLRANAGGKVVKNVAGYDLGKLFCGSRGRLGSVERLALRLHPRPRVARTLIADRSRWLQLHSSQLRAVEAQLLEFGGEEADRWAEVRELQATLRARSRWDGDEAPLVRPGPRVAYNAGETPAPESWSPLAQRVVEAMCTAS